MAAPGSKITTNLPNHDMDFLGSTTPADLLASVTTGVQTTGVQLWPILVFLGIPLAFVIYGYVVSAIKHSAGGRAARK